MKISGMSLFWKVIASISVLCVVWALYMLTVIYWEDRTPYEERREYYSSECYSVEYSDGHYEIYNALTGKATIQDIDWLFASDAYKDSLVIFSKKHKRGYFSRYTGQVVIPAQYPHAWIFAEGLAAVVADDRIGFIDRMGKVVIDFQYVYLKDNHKKADFIFRNGLCNMFDKSGKCGIINKRGEWVLRPRYDFICNPLNGKRIFIDKGKYGVLDDSLTVVIPSMYRDISIHPEYAIVTLPDGSMQQLSYDGKILDPLVYDRIEHLYYATGKYNDTGDEIQAHADCYAYIVNNNYGLMDLQGKPLTSAVYSGISAISKDLFECQLQNLSSSITVDAKNLRLPIKKIRGG